MSSTLQSIAAGSTGMASGMQRRAQPRPAGVVGISTASEGTALPLAQLPQHNLQKDRSQETQPELSSF